MRCSEPAAAPDDQHERKHEGRLPGHIRALLRRGQRRPTPAASRGSAPGDCRFPTAEGHARHARKVSRATFARAVLRAGSRYGRPATLVSDAAGCAAPGQERGSRPTCGLSAGDLCCAARRELPDLAGRAAPGQPRGVRRTAAGVSVPGSGSQLQAGVQALVAAPVRCRPAWQLAAPGLRGAGAEAA